jgi:hypothetical protein
MVNRRRPHIYILPEDDANRQLANGFIVNTDSNQIHTLTEAGGWTHVKDDFVSDHINSMRKFEERLMILLVDFDNASDRLQTMREVIPDDLGKRVFVLGVLTEPEALKRKIHGSYDDIGKKLANECRAGTYSIWTDNLLYHNQPELVRLREAVHAWLFKP